MLSNRQLFLRHLAQTTDFPLQIEIASAKGVKMYGPEGQVYFDLISGIGVSTLGHCHPAVVKAVQEQAAQYMHLMVYGEFVQSPQVKLAEALCATIPGNLDNVYLVNSGSEAVEGALKLAKRYTGRAEILSCIDAYHGSSHGSLSVGGNEIFKQAFRPLLPGIRHIRFGVSEDLEHINTQTAAIIIETVQGEAGVRTATYEYWQQLRKRCTETGTLLILDEIQSGFGRTGSFWAFEKYCIIPDILVTAKAMGGGMPIGAFIAPHHLMEVFKNNPILGHITTFGGHPVSAAASLATIQTIQGEQLFLGAETIAQRFIQNLQHPAIKEIRHSGLMMAVEFESFEILKPIIDQAIAWGVVTDWFLFCDNSMRIAPPLIITEQEVDEVCEVILRAIRSVVE